MIPTKQTIYSLWEIHHLPLYKRNHCRWVGMLALWFANRIRKTDSSISINTKLLEAAALLHDIDKKVRKFPGEHHPDAAVRILRGADMPKVADLVRTHALHAILDQKICPETWEQQLLFLADKMVKHTIITVDERFSLWRAERLPESTVVLLDAAYPKVKALEKKICSLIGICPDDLARLVIPHKTSTIGDI